MGLQKGLQKFYSRNNKFTDFTLVSMSGDEIQCHKIILASRSDFFLDMFDHIDEDSSNKHLVIEDASTKDLKAMVDFMYTEHVTKENGTVDFGRQIFGRGSKIEMSRIHHRLH